MTASSQVVPKLFILLPSQTWQIKRESKFGKEFTIDAMVSNGYYKRAQMQISIVQEVYFHKGEYSNIPSTTLQFDTFETSF